MVFKGFTIKSGPHSPAVEAIVSCQLYMAFWQDIEKMCNQIADGIHNKNLYLTCNNRRVARVFDIYSTRVKEGKAEWPKDWNYFSQYGPKAQPCFDEDKCVLPTGLDPLPLPDEDPSFFISEIFQDDHGEHNHQNRQMVKFQQHRKS